MNSTQIHLVDASGAVALIRCSDGSFVLFGTHAGLGEPAELAQRIAALLPHGRIDHVVHAGLAAGEGDLVPALLARTTLVACLERDGAAVHAPPNYLDLREGRPVETLGAGDVFMLGETALRLLQVAPDPSSDHPASRPVALLVSHAGRAESSILLAGATTGRDWGIFAAQEEPCRAACLVIDGTRPLDLVVTGRDHGLVCADHLRQLRAGTAVIGAGKGQSDTLRIAARQLYAHMARQWGGAGIVELSPGLPRVLVLDGARVTVAPREMPAESAVA